MASGEHRRALWWYRLASVISRPSETSWPTLHAIKPSPGRKRRRKREEEWVSDEEGEEREGHEEGEK